MFATLALREAAAQLLAADSATLAPAVNGNKVALIKTAFVPGENSALTDFTLADFDGSTPIVAGTGTQPEALDSQTSDAIIDIKVPAGGFRWETSGVTNLPQTIYGYCLTDNAGAVLLACQTLPVPLQLTAINQAVDLGPINIRQLANSMQ